VASESWDKSRQGRPGPRPEKFVVGFDTRFLSDRYAGDVARVLAANGFIVYLASVRRAHPHHLLCSENLHAIAGVMITASHNRPRYNGVKLKAA